MSRPIASSAIERSVERHSVDVAEVATLPRKVSCVQIREAQASLCKRGKGRRLKYCSPLKNVTALMSRRQVHFFTPRLESLDCFALALARQTFPPGIELSMHAEVYASNTRELFTQSSRTEAPRNSRVFRPENQETRFKG